MNKIIIETDAPANVIHLSLTDIHNKIPPLTSAALNFLEWSQPIILTPHKNRDKSFNLIGGYRTYRMLCAARALNETCQALIIPNISAENEEALGIFDSVAIRSIEQPYAEAGATIAAIIKSDKYVRKEMGTFSKVENDAQIAELFGIKNTTLHEAAKDWQKRQIRIEPKAQKKRLEALSAESINEARQTQYDD